MTGSRRWAVAGLVSGLAGLATSYAVALLLTIRESPVVAVAELVVRMTPGFVAERAIRLLGHADKPVLVVTVILLTSLMFVIVGWLGSRSWRWSLLAWLALAGFGLFAVLSHSGARATDALPVIVGFVTWVVCLDLLGRRVKPAPGADDDGRRRFLTTAATIGAGAAGVAVLGRFVGAGKRRVEESRRLLRLPGITRREPPVKTRIGVDGITPWRTRPEDFYLIDTTIAVPTITASDWRLRIHGLVDRELTLSFSDLLDRELTEAWITLNCVSNPVGGPLIGNAWWSGVRLAALLEEVGVQAGADAVLQTSDDGWTCGTPLSALTDDRDAMLAVAMNGRPLPLEHGFPVRTIVPGLYGYVSACKWVVDLEVTKFSDFSAYWTDRGWSEQGPVKLSSRIDVPRSGADVPAGDLRVGGIAWAQHTGVEKVEVALDGGAWTTAEIADPGTDDTWVQWAATVSVTPGDRILRVRATDKTGFVQSSALVDVVPNGSEGWHGVDFTVQDA
ncbi:molybdopterin-dependent oxidoreductase [Nocardioides sp. InS609-2]|uniref:molybdopterin-dependent oxidoreductase n=1 Tax=Nocardioides sp. InS609-2 TaxID=2760705 RepID=UPI0020C0F5B7|nr:molybdopterin-dependent oxidoreductase [Nocardioides sp. InS609-2]